MDFDRESWAETEFGSADLGDRRRTERLIQMAKQRASRPNASIAESCGDVAGAKAASDKGTGC